MYLKYFATIFFTSISKCLIVIIAQQLLHCYAINMSRPLLVLVAGWRLPHFMLFMPYLHSKQSQ